MRNFALFLFFIFPLLLTVLGQETSRIPTTIKSGEFSIVFNVSDDVQGQGLMDLLKSVADALGTQVTGKGLILSRNIILGVGTVKTSTGKQLNGLRFTVITGDYSPKSTYFSVKISEQTADEYKKTFSAFLDDLIAQIKSAK